MKYKYLSRPPYWHSTTFREEGECVSVFLRCNSVFLIKVSRIGRVRVRARCANCRLVRIWWFCAFGSFYCWKLGSWFKSDNKSIRRFAFYVDLTTWSCVLAFARARCVVYLYVNIVLARVFAWNKVILNQYVKFTARLITSVFSLRPLSQLCLILKRLIDTSW